MEVSLHPRQEEIFYSDARFKVVAAGRRFGKTYLAAVMLLIETARNEKTRSDGVTVSLALEEVFYIGPIFQTTKDNIWQVLITLGGSLIEKKWENTGEMLLVNGRRMKIKGTDRPDNIRGAGLSYVVMDEYAFMKGEVWEYVVEPMLMRSEGGAMFIGTPDGKNHFFDLWKQGNSQAPEFSEWASWTFNSGENVFLPSTELERKKATMSKDAYMQEIEASFEAGAGALMNRAMFPILEEKQVPYPGDYYISCDLAGFESSEGGRRIVKRDESAIAVVLNHNGGWTVVDLIHGHWDTRETALRIVKAYRDFRPVALGIEKGMSKNAVGPYLEDEMQRLGVFFTIEDLSHGNRAKTDRINWSLQGRAEKGRIQLLKGEWNRKFLEQIEDFPNPLAHDDLIDAVSYTDQLAQPWYDGPSHIDDWEPLDSTSGY